jgi:DNA polymerase III epsilon subunit-like protein
MVRILFFDTETTGLPRDKKISALEASNNWPELVSICWSIYDSNKHIRTEYHIIYPDHWSADESTDATEIHGITEEIARRKGEPVADVLALLKYDLERSTYIVAHNLHFDKHVLFHTYKWRLGIDPTKFWKESAEFCSCLKAKAELRLPALFPPYNVYRYPKLDELYLDTFKMPPPPNAHNAKRDVEVLAQTVLKRWNNLTIQ